MAKTDSIFASGPLRVILTTNHALQWASSVIVLGLAVWLSGALDRTLHEVYWISIGAINVWLYGWGLFMPLVKNYNGFLIVAHPIFAALWLTAFIFAVLDYNKHNCGDACRQKHALEAFTFVAFFFSLTAIPLEALYFLKQRREKPAVVEPTPAPQKESVKSEKSDENEISPVAESSTAAAHV